MSKRLRAQDFNTRFADKTIGSECSWYDLLSTSTCATVQAVANDWRALQFASTEMKKNKEIGLPHPIAALADLLRHKMAALVAIEQSWEAVRFIDEDHLTAWRESRSFR